MLTVAFDIGVKNLSYCVMDEHFKVIEWNIIDVTKHLDDKSAKNFHVLASSLFSQLQAHFSHDMSIDSVVIENQPAFKNPTMKSIQMCVYSFFAMRNLHLVERKIKMSFIAASTKVKLAEKLCTDVVEDIRKRYKNKYTYNKKISVHCATKLVNDCDLGMVDEKLCTDFSNSKKKDDLADALLLSLVFKNYLKQNRHITNNNIGNE